MPTRKQARHVGPAHAANGLEETANDDLAVGLHAQRRDQRWASHTAGCSQRRRHEGGIERAVRKKARHPAARLPLHGVELAADEHLATRQSLDGIHRPIGAARRAEAWVDAPVGQEARYIRSCGAVARGEDLREITPRQHLAVGLHRDGSHGRVGRGSEGWVEVPGGGQPPQVGPQVLTVLGVQALVVATHQDLAASLDDQSKNVGLCDAIHPQRSD